jgi:predicted Zn-dependent peptidase
MKKILFMAFVLLTATAAQAQKTNSIKFVEFDLDNGLHVILHEDHSTPIVAVSIMYHVGSKNEKEGRTGFAHFFEHLLFEGSKYIGRGEIDDYIEGAGGMLNANTSFDRTYYYEVLPSNYLELGLWIESERLLHANVEQVGIETQRKVVKEERRMRYDNRPYGRLLEEVMKRAFTVHPYRSTPIGSMADLDAAREEDYVNFYKTYYVPNNATISIAGDINVEEAKNLVIKYFKDIPRGADVQRPTIVEPAKTAEVRDTVYDNVQLPAVVMAYHTPPQGTDDYYAVEMLATLLARGESSRLNKVLVDEKEQCVNAGAFPISTEDPGVAIAYGICNMGVDPKEVEATIQAEIMKVQTELVSEKEFQKLQNQVENDFITANSTVAGIAESLANYHVYLGSASLINTEIERYRKVTRKDLQEAAKKYFSDTNRVVLYWLPKQK